MKLPNNFIAYGADGREIGITFETTPPFQTPWEMQQLVEWTNQATAEKWLHPLLVIAAFAVTFLAIHLSIRLYLEILEIFQSLPCGIDGRLLLLLAPHELSAFLPYTSDTRRKK